MSYKVLKFFESSEGYKKLSKADWRDSVYGRLVEISPGKGKKVKCTVDFMQHVVSIVGPGLAGMDLD